MIVNGLLPIGSVVLLKDSTKKVMIIGVCQRGANNPEKIWDYVGVVFPEGFLSPDKMFLFDTEQIDQLFAMGYQDAEQMAFKEKVDQVIQKMKSEK